MGLKHGKGTQVLMNGDRIIAEWENDILNGKGEYIYKNGDTKECVWKNGLMIPLGEQDKCCYGNSYLNALLILLTIGCVVVSPALAAILWIVMVAEATCCNSTSRYLGNIIALKNTGVTINNLI